MNEDNSKVQSKAPSDPYELLKQLGGPSKETVASWKTQTPNGRVRIFAMGEDRVYLLRAISVMELAQITKQMPKNAEPETIARDLPLQVVSKCCMWTNTTQDGKINADQLKAGAAGLPNTLYSFVEMMSDFVDPANFELLSSEL